MRGSPPSSVLKLGISSGVPSSRLAALLALHRAKEPETPVSMEEVTSSPDLIEGVKNGRYDIGFVATTTPADDAPLWREELAVAVPDRSPLLRYAAIPLGALLPYPLFQYCPLACEVLFDQEWPVLYRVKSYELMTVMVSAGYGVGIAPRSRIEQSRSWGVVMRPLADGSYWIGTHMFRSERNDAPAIERFVKRAQTIASCNPPDEGGGRRSAG